MIIVDFNEKCTADVYAYQYDYGQTLEIKGIADLPDDFKVHFENGSGQALVITGSIDSNSGNGKTGRAKIPDECLQQQVEMFKAWIFIETANSGTTIKTIRIHIIQREIPSDTPPIGSIEEIKQYADYVKENAEKVSQAEQAANAANTAAEAAQATADEIKEQAESGAFDGEQGPQGEKGEKGDTGPQGPPGEDGASPFTVISPGKTEAEAYEILLPGMYVVSNVGYISIGSVNSVSADIQTKTPLKVGYPAVIFYGFTGLTASDDIGYIILLGSDVQLYTQNVRGELKEKNFKLSSNLAEFDGVEIDFPTFVSVMETLLTSLAEMIVAKKNAPTISNVTISNITLNNNNEYRMQSTASLNLALPLTIPDDYECSLVFESGATATVLSYPADSIKFIGDDCDAEGDFIPEANTGYEISVKNLGFDRVVARVGAF